LPHGTRIYNKLMNMIKAEYFERDYDEVITPNIFNLKLWETSGHAAKYKENMFLLDVEGQEFGLKPMNCPAHCMLFKHRKRSYRELPLRMADFGTLHRNELSGEPPPPRPALAQGRVPVTCPRRAPQARSPASRACAASSRTTGTSSAWSRRSSRRSPTCST